MSFPRATTQCRRHLIATKSFSEYIRAGARSNRSSPWPDGTVAPPVARCPVLDWDTGEPRRMFTIMGRTEPFGYCE